MNDFFVKRGTKMMGPLSKEKLSGLIKANKLKPADQISTIGDGPWDKLSEVYKDVLAGTYATTEPVVDEFEPDYPDDDVLKADKSATDFGITGCVTVLLYIPIAFATYLRLSNLFDEWTSGVSDLVFVFIVLFLLVAVPITVLAIGGLSIAATTALRDRVFERLQTWSRPAISSAGKGNRGILSTVASLAISLRQWIHSLTIGHFWVAFGCSLVGLFILNFLGSSRNESVKPRGGGSRLEIDVDREVDDFMEEITSTSAGRIAVERIGNKDNELTRFQRENGISDAVAEAAIKEWVLSHGGDFDWDLDDVKRICLRIR